MSSIIGTDSLPVGSDSNDRYSAVNRKQPEGLADYVRRIRFEKGFSLLDVQRNSHSKIAGSYVSRIENGIAGADGVTPKKLQALALGLQVPEEEIFAVARGKPLTAPEVFDSEIYLMLKGYDELSDKDKSELLATVRMLSAEIRRRRLKTPKAVEREDDAAGNSRRGSLIPPGGRRLPVVTRGTAKPEAQKKGRA